MIGGEPVCGILTQKVIVRVACLLTAACMSGLSTAVLYAESQLDHARERQEMRLAAAKLSTIHHLQRSHYAAKGYYGNGLSLAVYVDSIGVTGSTDWILYERVEVQTSFDGSAYLAIIRVRPFRIECAIERGRDISGQEARSVRDIAVPVTSTRYGWPPHDGIECRRKGLPWTMVHWAGIGYFNHQEVVSDISPALAPESGAGRP